MGAGTDLWYQGEAMTNEGDMVGLASLFTGDAVYISPSGRYEGREAIRSFLEEAAKGVADLKQDTTLVIEQGDDLMAEWKARYRITGALPGLDVGKMGATVEQSGVSVCKLRDGKCVYQRDYFDQVDLMTQLGLMHAS
jgi:ketosteroid isomerase-like protein